MIDNIMRCETCGSTHHEKILFEKPKRIVFGSDLTILEQNTGDQREQENICTNCFLKEVEKVAEAHKTRATISSSN